MPDEAAATQNPARPERDDMTDADESGLRPRPIESVPADGRGPVYHFAARPFMGLG